MPDVYGVEYTKAWQNVVSSNSEASKSGGRVRVIIDTYTALGTETTGDSIMLGGMQLPAGAQVVGYTVDAPALASIVRIQWTGADGVGINISALLDFTLAGVKTELGETAFSVINNLSTEPMDLSLSIAGGTLPISSVISFIFKYTLD